MFSNGVIFVDYIKLADNLKDPFTKGSSRDQVLKSSKEMDSLHMIKDDI